MDRAVDTANLAIPGADLSLWGLFIEADIVVKIVMLGLLAASVWVWAVVFEKWSSLRKVNRDADGFEDRFWSGGSLDELFDHEANNPMNGAVAPTEARKIIHRSSRAISRCTVTVIARSTRSRTDERLISAPATRTDRRHSPIAAPNTAAIGWPGLFAL